MTANIKPCPFCGNQPTVREWVETSRTVDENFNLEYYSGVLIRCKFCDIDMYDVDRWNNRAIIVGGDKPMICEDCGCAMNIEAVHTSQKGHYEILYHCPYCENEEIVEEIVEK